MGNSRVLPLPMADTIPYPSCVCVARICKIVKWTRPRRERCSVLRGLREISCTSGSQPHKAFHIVSGSSKPQRAKGASQRHTDRNVESVHEDPMGFRWRSCWNNATHRNPTVLASISLNAWTSLTMSVAKACPRGLEWPGARDDFRIDQLARPPFRARAWK